MKCRHVLVPLDLVCGRADALFFVQDMAAEAPVSVTLLHVIELNISASAQAVAGQLRAESQAALRKLARLFFGVEQAVRISVRQGVPAAEILAEAQSMNVDLIVLATPKPGRRLFRRNTTQRVIKAAQCPTLVLPQRGLPGEGFQDGPPAPALAEDGVLTMPLAAAAAA